MERETFSHSSCTIIQIHRLFVKAIRIFFSFLFVGIRGEMSRVVWDSSLSCVVIWVFVRGCERGFGKVIACGKTTTLHPVLLTI